jgi:hypothetical protein
MRTTPQPHPNHALSCLNYLHGNLRKQPIRRQALSSCASGARVSGLDVLHVFCPSSLAVCVRSYSRDLDLTTPGARPATFRLTLLVCLHFGGTPISVRGAEGAFVYKNSVLFRQLLQSSRSKVLPPWLFPTHLNTRYYLNQCFTIVWY